MLFRHEQLNKYSKIAFFAVSALILFLTAAALPKYAGNSIVYISFTLISNALLYVGFSKNAIFFDAFIGVFFWLGFWLKLTLRVAFSDGVFNQPVGSFDGSGIAFDKGLLVTTCGLLGLLVASLIRRKYFFNYPKEIGKIEHWGMYEVYKKYRKIILFLFVSIFIFIAVSNALLVIYQRGSITQTFLPFGLNGVYKWLLLFGLASISALILRFELEINKKTSLWVMFLSLLESFTTNVSLLSRGMILNSAALIYGVVVSLKLHSIKSRLSFFITTGIIFCILVAGSVFLVNKLRSTVYFDGFNSEMRAKEEQSMAPPLFIDRWVGMEGVMAVSSYPNLNWDLFKKALQEKYDEKETSFYDNNFIESSYVDTNKSKHHFISLPGIVAFFFYPGSFVFLFLSMFALGSFAAFVEFSVYKLGGMNVILCALLAQVVAFRFASFGYVPAQSYLLFGSLFLNIFIIYFAEHLIRFLKKDRANQSAL